MLEVFKFECHYQLRSPLFIVLALVFFLFAFLIIAVENVQLGGISSNLNVNAAWSIVYMQFFFSLIGMLAVIAIVSQAITRDYELKTAELMFATGIGPRQFLLGRFFGAGLFGLLVGVAAILGTLAGSVMPWQDPDKTGAFTLTPYVYAFAVVTLPNLFFSAALFFSVAALFRSMLAAFTAAVGFLVLYVVVSNIVDPEQIDLFAVLDPFGQTAFGEVSRYWTVYERNYELVPVDGAFLLNRLLWVGIGLAMLALTAWRYRFSLNPSPFKFRRKRNVRQVAPPAGIRPARIHRTFSFATYRQQLTSQLRIDLSGIVKSVPFYAILGFAALNVWGGFASVGHAFGTPLLPVTSALLLAIANSYVFFILLIIIYYSGELVHRERQTRVAEVIDGAPFPSTVMVASKIGALWFIVTCLLLFAMAAAILRQLSEGYTNFELGLYLQSLFFVQGGFFYLLAVLAVFVQVLAGNKWLGMLAMLVVFIVFQTLPSIDLQHGLYSFGTPPAPHSDMNGYGHYWLPLVAFTVYWGFFCVLLTLVAHLFFKRGNTFGFEERLRVARARTSLGVISTGGVALLAFVATGIWVFVNTNVINTYRTTDSAEAQRADYEKTFKADHEKAPLPEMLAVDSEVDLFPAERRLESRGLARLVNETAETIDTLLISTHPLIVVNALEMDRAEITSQDKPSGAHIFTFEPALKPGEEVQLSWDLTWDHNGFANPNEAAVTGGANNRVVANGTFVNNSEIMPSVGYNSGLELTDPNTRRDHELPPIQRLPDIGDPFWLNRSQLGLTRRTAFKTTFSTSADQIAVAPGYLVGEMEERNGRRYFTYEMDEPIWPFFSFVSARYEVARDRHDDVVIEIYYDAKHPYNIEPMIRGTKKSLDYFNREFSPYQYRQFRILEFPRYASFAQSFPNTIPYSEAIGFVADLRDEDSLDLVFYVTAHELAHQWWGHQVAGARVQGMAVIVETLAQYSALMVMEKEYGPDKMRRFLRYELDRYLQRRGGELIEELPLMLSENQPYIHYQKGSLVMYALKDVIGEDRVNLALRSFLAKWAYGTGPFPTAQDLVNEFRAVADEEHQNLITDLFEKITVYDLRVGDVEIKPVQDEWEVRFVASATQYDVDGQGRETEVPLDTWVDFAVFPLAGDDLEDYQLPAPLHFEKRRIKAGETEFVVRVADEPRRVGVDPYNKLIDRNPEDNLKYISAEG